MKDVASALRASAWYFSAILKAFLKSKTKVRSAMRKFEPIIALSLKSDIQIRNVALEDETDDQVVIRIVAMIVVDIGRTAIVAVATIETVDILALEIVYCAIRYTTSRRINWLQVFVPHTATKYSKMPALCTITHILATANFETFGHFTAAIKQPQNVRYEM